MNALNTVREILAEVQEMSGRPYVSIAGSQAPIGTLDGFDSLSSIEATVMLEAKFGINADGNSLFISDDGTKALTLDEIAARIENLVKAHEPSHA